MSPITIYTTRFCPYCVSAKELLRKKGVGFDEIDVTGDPAGRRTMTERSDGRTTVPQIFIGAGIGVSGLRLLDGQQGRDGAVDRQGTGREAGGPP